MKSLEDQYQNIKNEYNDKISNPIKNKMQKYMNVVRQMHKNQLIKPSQQKSIDDKIIISIKNQFLKLRRQIQGQYKMNLSDYQAYLWKIQKLLHIQKPPILSHIKLVKQAPAQICMEQIKKNINFPILNCKVKDLIKIATQIMTQNKFCSQNFSHQCINKLITHISLNYNILAYHNFTHAFSVFIMIVQTRSLSNNLGKMFSQYQFFIAYLSALCHDLNHKGTNSDFQIKKKTQIALIYNNQSVLQNMHISQFYRICKQNPDIDIISKIKSSVQRQNAKRLLNRLILATDVHSHSKNLKRLENFLLTKKQHSQLDQNQKQLILQNLFHACDLGNPCLEFNNYINWSILIGQQFNNQVALEKNQNIDVSANLQYINIQTHYRRQIGFINYLVLPIWTQIANIFPDLDTIRTRIQQNRQKLTKAVEN